MISNTVLDELQKDLVKAAGLITGGFRKTRKTVQPLLPARRTRNSPLGEVG
jgi:hypothetical protein